MKHILNIFIISLLLFSCQNDKTLPIYGQSIINTPNGGTDTLTKKIPPFEFTNQEGKTVNNSTLENKIYVTEFFFSYCPSICPIMKRNMLEVYKEFYNNDDVMILSHSIDPKRDSVQRLNEYAEKLGIDNTEKWHLVTGDKDWIYLMAQEYMILAFEDDDVPGGFEHSGHFILVDKKSRIRGYYEGTKEDDVQKMIKDIKTLLKEK
jgi:protein SCO1/2